MNGKEMIHAAIEAICTRGQACLLSHTGELIIFTSYRVCAGEAISFAAMTVDAEGQVDEWSLKLDAEKMYQRFRSVA